MRRQLKIIGTMVAIILALIGYVYLCAYHPSVIKWFFGAVFCAVMLIIFYAGVASFFDEY